MKKMNKKGKVGKKKVDKKSGSKRADKYKGGNGNNGNGKLTVKEKLFVEEYLKDFNATRAYKVVHGNGMKENSAWTNACQTLSNTKVMTEIDRRLTELFEKLEVSNNMLIAAYVNEAFYDKRPFFVEDDVFVGMKNLNITQQACIESIEREDIFSGIGEDRIRVGVRTRIKFCNRKAARDVLMKYKGLIRDTINNNTIILGNKTEVTITAAKELKESLGDKRIIELDKLLSKQD